MRVKEKISKFLKFLGNSWIKFKEKALKFLKPFGKAFITTAVLYTLFYGLLVLFLLRVFVFPSNNQETSESIVKNHIDELADKPKEMLKFLQNANNEKEFNIQRNAYTTTHTFKPNLRKKEDFQNVPIIRDRNAFGILLNFNDSDLYWYNYDTESLTPLSIKVKYNIQVVPNNDDYLIAFTTNKSRSLIIVDEEDLSYDEVSFPKEFKLSNFSPLVLMDYYLYMLKPHENELLQLNLNNDSVTTYSLGSTAEWFSFSKPFGRFLIIRDLSNTIVINTDSLYYFKQLSNNPILSSDTGDHLSINPLAKNFVSVHFKQSAINFRDFVVFCRRFNDSFVELHYGLTHDNPSLKKQGSLYFSPYIDTVKLQIQDPGLSKYFGKIKTIKAVDLRDRSYQLINIEEKNNRYSAEVIPTVFSYNSIICFNSEKYIKFIEQSDDKLHFNTVSLDSGQLKTISLDSALSIDFNNISFISASYETEEIKVLGTFDNIKDVYFFLELNNPEKPSIGAINTLNNKPVTDILMQQFDFKSTSVTTNKFIVSVFCFTILILYLLGYAALKELFESKNRSITIDKIIDISTGNEKFITLKFQIQEANKQISSLKLRSQIMLFLGIVLGVGGVAVFYWVLSYNKIDLETEGITGWNYKTVMAILRPTILLIFIETFTFFFLKQYRIIFNEYKLFLGFQSHLLNYLATLNANAEDTEKVSDLLEALTKNRFDLHETGTRVQVDEFKQDSIVYKIVEALKDKIK